MEIKEITNDELNTLINKWDNGQPVEKALFLTKDGSYWVAVDNSTDDCWLEQFHFKHNAIRYLKDRYDGITELIKQDRKDFLDSMTIDTFAGSSFFTVIINNKQEYIYPVDCDRVEAVSNAIRRYEENKLIDDSAVYL